jgi:hypothetical protein
MFPDPQSHSLCRPLDLGCSWSSTSTSFSGVTPQLPLRLLRLLPQSLHLLKAHQSLQTSLTPDSLSCIALYKSSFISYYSTSSSTTSTSTSSFLPSFLTPSLPKLVCHSRLGTLTSQAHLSNIKPIHHSLLPHFNAYFHLQLLSSAYNNIHFLTCSPVHLSFSLTYHSAAKSTVVVRASFTCSILGRGAQYKPPSPPLPLLSERQPSFYTFLVIPQQHTHSQKLLNHLNTFYFHQLGLCMGI